MKTATLNAAMLSEWCSGVSTPQMVQRFTNLLTGTWGGHYLEWSCGLLNCNFSTALTPPTHTHILRYIIYLSLNIFFEKLLQWLRIYLLKAIRIKEIKHLWMWHYSELQPFRKGLIYNLKLYFKFPTSPSPNWLRLKAGGVFWGQSYIFFLTKIGFGEKSLPLIS